MRKRHRVYRVYREQVFFFRFVSPPPRLLLGRCVWKIAKRKDPMIPIHPSIRLTAVFVLLLTMENWEMIENESERGGGGKREGEG